MNKWIGVGNLARDPELRTGASGVPICTFTLAVNRRFANREGVREADFINVVTFKQTAENCAKFLAKGRKAGVVGSIQTRNYTGDDGVKHYATEILADEVEFLSSPSQAGGSRNDAPPPPEPDGYQGAGPLEGADNEPPFWGVTNDNPD